MKLLMRPALAALLVAAGFALAGCPERPPQPRTVIATPPVAWPAAAMPVALRSLPDFTHLVEEVGPAVVNVTALARVTRPEGELRVPPEQREFFRRFMPDAPSERTLRGVASGVIISADGYVLTNAHVVENAETTSVRLPDGRGEHVAKVVGVDARTDIALLKLEASGLPFARTGNSQRLKVGEWVVAIGSPFGFDNTLTAGVVSAKERRLPNGSGTPFLQTDVAVNPGNSGGPLLNLAGEVVGINSQIFSRTGGYMGVSFAIPIEVALKVSRDLRDHGFVSRGRIGVIVLPVTREIAERAGLAERRGAVVDALDPAGPARRAGIAVGDILLKFGGEQIGNDDDLARIVADTKPGTQSKAELWRNGRRIVLDVSVAEMPRELTMTEGNSHAGKAND